MGLGIYVRWHGQTEAEEKAQYTGFQTTGEAGYLRSSYNDGGFNAWARRMLGCEGFYHIFDYAEEKEQPITSPGGEKLTEEYSKTGFAGEEGEDWGYITGFFPDWDACLARTQALIQQAAELDHLYLVRPGSNLGKFPETPGRDDVLAVYREQMARGVAFSDEDAWYSNRVGFFCPKKSPVVRAVIWAEGYRDMEPVLVCESDEDPHTYYKGVLQDVLAFIDLGRRKEGWLVWSA